MKLRELKEKDAEEMLKWMHSENSKKVFIKDFNRYSLADVKKFINAKNTDENMNFACVDDNDNYLGTVSLKNIDYINKNAEYAISFTAEACGTGASTFATQEILRIAFRDLELAKVYLNVLDINTRAIKFYNKVGFVEEGRFRKHILKNDELRDLLWFSILKEDYKDY